MIVFTSRCTMTLLCTGSGMASRRATAPFLGISAPRFPLLGPFGPVLRAPLAPVGDARGIDRPTDDVIPDPGQIRHASAADEHDGVLLEVVADPRNVGGDLVLVRESDAGDLPHGGIRLLGCHRLPPQGAPPVAHELIDCRHRSLPLLA